MTGTVLDRLVLGIERATEHAANADTRPAAVLWPDEARQWEPLLPRLRERLPVLTLGTYEPASWTGPAYWLRCIVDEAVPPPMDGVPVVYLPGYARSDIRAVAEAPSELKPLAELQYRGVLFTQSSGRDWTLAAFMQAPSGRGGLGIEVGSDEASKQALLRARLAFLDQSVEELRRRAPLRASFFDELLTPDIDRQVLQWLNDPVAFRSGLSPEEWEAFRERFFDRFRLRLEQGDIEVARALGKRDTDPWQRVWRAYADAPRRYPKVEDRLRAARPKQLKEGPGLFDVSGSWPQENEDGEARLRTALTDAGALDAEAARARLLELDSAHGDRRQWVWADLGRAPLAAALEHLAVLARQTRVHVRDGLEQCVDDYVGGGWRADDALLRAVAAVESDTDAQAVGTAGRAAYGPWLEVAAERMAAAVVSDPGRYVLAPVPDGPGTCLLFTDGLRFDLGLRLADLLAGAGIEAKVEPRLAALPTITPTAKPAVSPAAGELHGSGRLGVCGPAGEVELTADGLRREIARQGYQTLGLDETGDPSGRGWTEQGDIDALGHEHQHRLPSLVDSELAKLVVRIRSLLDAGWRQVVVVTDHGWLYLPGGLPKAELAQHLTKDGAMRKGRAARLAEGAVTDIPMVPWHWDSNVRVAVAPGIRVFSGSPAYEHGGISPQECITPVVIATQGSRSSPDLQLAVAWSGLRAHVSFLGALPPEAQVDLRVVPGDFATSLSGGSRPLGADGKASLLVADEDQEGAEAFAVVVADGRVLAQLSVIVGGGQ